MNPSIFLRTVWCAVIVLLICGCMDDESLARELANPRFEVWCGESACAWAVESGTVARAPTWHRRVYGISLVSDGAAISQEVEMEDLHCLFLSLLGKVDGGTDLHFEVFYDGSDPSAPVAGEPISGMNWKTVHREVPVPEGATRARIVFRKSGSGAAIISRVSLEGDTNCAARCTGDGGC